MEECHAGEVTMETSSPARPILRYLDHSEETDDGRRESHVETLSNDENRDPAQSPDRMDVDDHSGEGMSMCVTSPGTKLQAGHEGHDSNRANDSTDGGRGDTEEYDDFDPYLFIKHLPSVSEVVSTSRCTSLLPKQTRRCPPITLVLDLDGECVCLLLDIIFIQPALIFNVYFS